MMDNDTLEALRDFVVISELWGIENTLERLREEQWLAASATIASVELVAQAVERLQASVERQTRVLERGFETIQASLGFQTYMLDRILDAVNEPDRAKQSRWLRQNGEKHLHAGLYDEALRDFLASLEAYGSDYTCHFSVAALHLLRDDWVAAWESCESVLKYARLAKGITEEHAAAYHSSRALCLMGQMLEDGDLVEEALAYYVAACTASPTYGECFLRSAGIAAKLKRRELCVLAARAAVLVDSTQSVLIDRDRNLQAFKEDVGKALESIRSESSQGAAGLVSVAKDSVSVYAHVVTLLQEAPLTKAFQVLDRSEQEGLATLETHEEYLSRKAFRGEDLSRHGALVDASNALQYLWESAVESSQLVKRLGPYVRWVANSIRNDMASRAADIREWAKSEIDKTERETAYEIDAGSGCGGAFLVLVGLAIVVGALYGGASGEWQPGEYGPFAFLGAFIIGLVFVAWLLWWIGGWNRRSARRSRRSGIAEAVRSAEQDKAQALKAADEAEASLGDVDTVTARVRMAEDLVNRDDVVCSLVLLEAGEKSDRYDESALAEQLHSIAKSCGHHISAREARDAIRRVPSLFLTNLTTSMAWRVAAFLRRDWGVSVGVIRRYVGDFPWTEVVPTRSALQDEKPASGNGGTR